MQSFIFLNTFLVIKLVLIHLFGSISKQFQVDALMMTAEGRKSPVHVHVDRETPVHVHLKKKKKGKPGVPTAVEVSTFASSMQ